MTSAGAGKLRKYRRQAGAERTTGQSWRRIGTELQRLHLVTLEGAAGAVQQTTQPTDAQRAILAALKIEPPSRITALEPA